MLVQQPDQELGRDVGRDEVDADQQALAAYLGDQVRAVGHDRVGDHVGRDEVQRPARVERDHRHDAREHAGCDLPWKAAISR